MPPPFTMIEPVEINQAFAWYCTRVPLSVDLSGRVALVTGGSQGIGAGIAAVLVEAGATVVTCARSAVPDPLPGTTHVQCDVRDPEAVQRHGRRRSWPSTVGSTSWSTTPADRRTPLAADASPRFLDKVLGLNLTAPLLVAQAANAVMQRQGERGDREHLLGLGAASLARHRGVRRCQGRRGQPDQVAGRRVGPEGARQHRRRRACAAPSRPPTTTAATRPSRAIEATIPLGRMAEPARGRPGRGVPRLRPRQLRLRRLRGVPRRRRATCLPDCGLHVVQKENP